MKFADKNAEISRLEIGLFYSDDDGFCGVWLRRRIYADLHRALFTNTYYSFLIFL